MEVDLNNVTRGVIRNFETIPSDALAVDADNNRVLMIDSILKQIVLVDLGEEDRTVLEGEGVEFSVPRGADFF